MLAKMAPGRNSKSPRSWLKTFTPVTSVGRRSGVNWILRKEQSMDRAMLLASMVFPTPGTSSIRRWPSATSAARARRTSRDLPWMTCSTFRWMASKSDANRSHSAGCPVAATPASHPSRVLARVYRYGPVRQSPNENTEAGPERFPGPASNKGSGWPGPSYLGTPRAAPCSLAGALHPSDRATTLPCSRDYTRVIPVGQAHRPFPATRDFENPVAILGRTYDGPSTRSQRDRTTARRRPGDESSGARPQRQGRRDRFQRRGVPVGADDDPGAFGGEAAVLRTDPLPGPRGAHPPGRVRPGPLDVPILRATGRERRPCHPEVRRRGACVGERRGGVSAMQPTEGEPPPARDRAEAGSAPVRAGGRVPPVARPSRTGVGAVPLLEVA